MSNRLSLRKIIGDVTSLENGKPVGDSNYYNAERAFLLKLEKRYTRASIASGVGSGGAILGAISAFLDNPLSNSQIGTYLIYGGILGVGLCCGVFALSGVYFDVRDRLEKAVDKIRT